jgi:simple sugar transport system permease protein
VTTWVERLESPVSARLRDPALTGYAAIVLGALAAFVAIPPIQSRTITWPIVVGIAAAALGTWTAVRGRHRLGWGAAVTGLIGMGLGILATHSSTDHLNAVFDAALIAQMFAFTTPLVFAAIGGTFSERSGVVNIGLEGLMLMGAFWGVYGADKGGWGAGLMVAIGVGAVLALVYGFFAIQLRADQIVGGTAVNFLALGITGYVFIDHYGDNGTPDDISRVPDVNLPFLKGGFFDHAIGHLNLLTWLALLTVPALTVYLFRTRRGLRLRAVGEKPRAADTVGVSVFGTRYVAVTASGMLAALGGAYLSVAFVGSFSQNMTEGRGFIALAAVIFGKWRPAGALAATLLFGFSSALANRLPTFSESTATLFQALPYVLTLIAVAGVIGRSRAPGSIGIPYVKE